MGSMKRSEFLKRTTSLAATVLLSECAPSRAATQQEPTYRKLPRWRGFNLLERFTIDWGTKPFQEQDFAWIAEWGFDFVRLPLDYRFWAAPNNWREIREDALKGIAQAIDWGRQYEIHVCLNFHRTPGYCVNPPKEPKDLWTDEEAVEVSAVHWAHFAQRYKGRPNRELSFNLINEPAHIKENVYANVVTRLVQAIRAEDPDRLIIADGLDWARTPVRGLVPLKIAQSTRGYDPMRLTHYRASWIAGSETWDVPQWPMKEKDRVWSKDRLRRERIEPWKRLESLGAGVIVGEWGAFNQTPYDVVLAWMRDCLDLWKEADWSWALWSFRGGFGILDSDRPDVKYEQFRGHKLDRKMLELLRLY